MARVRHSQYMHQGSYGESAPGALDGDLGAKDVPYDNTTSGLAATNTKDAIDELAATSGGIAEDLTTTETDTGKRLGPDGAGGVQWDPQFDATAPVTQAFGDSADTGSADTAAHRDHKHGMPSVVDSVIPLVWGDGSDGSLTLHQGDAAPTGMTKAGAGASTTFTLNRDWYFTDLTLDASGGVFALVGGNWRIFVSGSCTIGSGCSINNDGHSGSMPSVQTIGAGLTGGPGAGPGGGAGTSGGSASNSAASVNASATKHGGDGGAASGGPGTGGGASGGNASNPLVNGSPRNLWQALVARTAAAGVFTGGGSGGGGASAVGSSGGNGGSSGGALLLIAKRLVNNGTISANGYRGADASGTGTGAGGGGGGGGGFVVLIYGATGSTLGTVTVTGGTGGNAQGAGKNGANGVDGQTYIFAL